MSHPEDVDVIAGGFYVPKGSTHIPSWQLQEQRLDHDHFLVPYCAQFIPTGGCAVDGGAFDGDATIAYSAKAGNLGCVYAIEPGPLAFKCLDHNAKLFNFGNVIPRQVALGAKAGHVAHVVHSGGDLGMSFCLPSEMGPIELVTLDSLADRPIDFIKLDLEGWELDALKGASRILAYERPIMVLEINTAALALCHASYEAISALLASADYLHRQVDGQNKDPNLWDEVCWPREMGPDPLAQA